MDVDKIDRLLNSYDPLIHSWLIQGLKFGFDLGYCGEYTNIMVENLKSARSRPGIMSPLVEKEVINNRFLGPFSSPPFENFRVNALGFVPKKTPNEYRLIVDLSQPSFESVNFHIPRDAAQVTYPTIQDAIDIIIQLKMNNLQPYLTKLDIKSAFRLLPLSPSNFPLMGIKYSDSYYIDAFLPMGASSSCQIFQIFSEAIAYIAQSKGNIPYILPYLDDYLLISTSYSSASQDLSFFTQLASEIRLPLAEDKTTGPTKKLTFLGIELDVDTMESRLPQEKIAKAEKLIATIMSKKRVHIKQLESLHGYLNYCAQIIPAGRAFIRSISALLHSTSPWISLPKCVLLDLETWKFFLNQFNGKAMFVSSLEMSPPEVELKTDSSGSFGCGAIFGQEFFSIEWPPPVPRENLALLEFYPIMLATIVWARKMQNLRIKILCDNLAVVHIINNLKSKDVTTMKLVRIFTLQCLIHNILFQAHHLPGKDNHGPDALSRGQLERFATLYPECHPIATPIPHKFLPFNLLIP